MSPRNRHIARMVAAFLVITLLQVYVLADATRPGATLSAESSSVLYGKLDLPGSRSIYVNGNSVASGTTIFSGAQLQTPADTEASVLLGSAGQVYIAPNSKLTLTFDKTSVDAVVETGNAVLSTNEGVTGTVRSADGKVLSSSSSSASASLPPTAANRRAAAALSKEEKLAFIIIPVVVAAIIVIVAVNNDDDNDNSSPSTP